MAYDLAVRPAPTDWLWQTIDRRFAGRCAAEPHRPGVIEVASAQQRAALRPHLEACEIECGGRSPRPIRRDLRPNVAEPRPAHLDGPRWWRFPACRRRDREFLRRRGRVLSPHALCQVSGDLPIEIGCDKFQSGPWYAVVLGQSGITLGLALYEGAGNLEAVLCGDVSEAEHARHTSAISVTFGEAFEMPIRDLDAAERCRWPVVSPDAYPCAMRVNPGSRCARRWPGS